MPSSRVHAGSTLIALGLAAGVFMPAEAHAQEATRLAHAPSVGLMISLSFGDRVAFGLGADLRYTMAHIDDATCPGGCGGAGVFAQATWLNFSAGRFALGLHGGGRVDGEGSSGPDTFLDGEVGWTYRTAWDLESPGGHGLHLGGLFMPAGAMTELSLRGVIPYPLSVSTPEVIVGAGVRAPGAFGYFPSFGSGRPLRCDEGCATPGVQVTPFAPRRGSRRAGLDLDEATRQALAHAWIEDARAECASIPAFLALARDLLAVGAPADLVARAVDAARDELRHTAIAAEMAGDYAGMHVAPELLSPPPRAAQDRLSALVRLAVESWQDGCVSEGAAATRALRGARAAADPRARGALAVIARDEARHAALGWDVMAFCLAAGGPPVREALAAAIAAAPEDPGLARDGDLDRALWRAHGRLSRSAAEASWEATLGAARREAARRLAAA